MDRESHEELMSTAKYRPGDIVWTNVKTYSPWPGKVIRVSDNILKLYPDPTKILHYVELYQKKDRDFLPEDELFPFDEGQERFSSRKKSLAFFQAMLAARQESTPGQENSIIDVENSESFCRTQFPRTNARNITGSENLQTNAKINEGPFYPLSSKNDENDFDVSIFKPCGSSKLAQNKSSTKIDFVPSKKPLKKNSTLGKIQNKDLNSQDIYEFSESDTLTLNMGRRGFKHVNPRGSVMRGETSRMDVSGEKSIPQLDRASRSRGHPKPPPMNITMKRKRPIVEKISETKFNPKVEVLNESMGIVSLKAEMEVKSSFDDQPKAKTLKTEKGSVTRRGRKSKKRLCVRKYASYHSSALKKKSTVPRSEVTVISASRKGVKVNAEPKVIDLTDEKTAVIDQPASKPGSSKAIGAQPKIKAQASSSHMMLGPKLASPALSERKSVGFLGFGGLGQKIVKRLLADGHDVTLWNRSLYKCYEMVDLGCQTKSTAEQVVTACDVIFCCVTHTAAVKEVFYSPTGVQCALREGKSFVVLTTIEPKVSSAIEAAVKEKGAMYLESPMFPAGGTIIDNNLLTVVGGSQSCLRVCVPFFRSFVKDLFYVGDVPEGNKMILLMKTLSGVKIAALAESMALAEKCDVPTDILFQIVKQTQIASPFLISKAESMLKARSQPPDDIFPLAHFSNDLSSTLNLTSDLDTPVIAAAKQVYLHSKLRGYSQHDVSAVYLKYTEPF